MIDNNSDEAYEAQVAQKINEEEQKQFEAEYEKIKKNYKVTINDEVWDEIVMGETTIIKSDDNKETTGETEDANESDQTSEDSQSKDANESDQTSEDQESNNDSTDANEKDDDKSTEKSDKE